MNLYKKPEKMKFKNFAAGYMGRFYRKLADNVDNFLGPDVCGTMRRFHQRIFKNTILQQVIC